MYFYLFHLFVEKKSKNTQEIRMPVGTTDESRIESRIEKRESGNSDFTNISNAEKALINQKEDTSLINNRSFVEPQKNVVMLPFVQTGRAELRVRIEKIPMNESSLISPNYWTDRSVEISPCSITLPKYNMSDEILDVTNLELAPNFDSAGRKKANNVTVKITLKKLDLGNASSQETTDSENTSSYNAYSVGSNVSEIEDNRNIENGKYDRMNEMSVELSDEDAKSRAKRNQQVTSKHYLSDKNVKESMRFKDTEQGIGDTKREKIRYGRSRAMRSIEEIKDLAEKLIVKVRYCSITHLCVLYQSLL